jgi:hypothetical protein
MGRSGSNANQGRDADGPLFSVLGDRSRAGMDSALWQTLQPAATGMRTRS